MGITDPRCGTYAGVMQHANKKEPCCPACKMARRDYQRKYRQQGRDNWLRRQGYGKTCVRGLGWPVQTEIVTGLQSRSRFGV